MKNLAQIFVVIFLLFSPFSALSAGDGIKENGRAILTTAGIVHVGPEAKIALIQRGKEPFGLALFGGHIEPMEAPEEAFLRELEEELNVTDVFNMSLLGVNGKFGRDPRQHSVEVTYVCCTNQNPVAGSDAKSVHLYTLDEVKQLLNEQPNAFAFDHGDILRNYFELVADANPCQTVIHYGLQVAAH